MYKALNLSLSSLSNTLFKIIFFPTLLLVLTACGNNKNAIQLSGNAVKGIISNGLISAYLIEPHLERTLLGQTHTNSAGEYEIDLPTLQKDAVIVLELTAESNTTMRCDVVDGCLYPDTSSTLFAEFGEEIPLPTNFKLVGYTLGNNLKSAFISPLSHIVYATANSLPGGLSASNLETSLSRVAQIFNLKTNLLNAKLPDLTALASLNGLSDQQLKLAILSSAFYPLTMSDNWANDDIELSQLPLEEIFRNAAYAAEALSSQLSKEQSTYSEALTDINVEAETMAQTFESKQLVIIQQPNSITVNEGQGFSLHVQATGDGDLSYQWSKNSLIIPSANSAGYNVSDANIDDAGSYSVTITDGGSQITSLNALVSVKKVIAPISITQQPQDLNLIAGDSINLSVSVAGDGPFDYQWQKEGSLLLGETSSTLHIPESTVSNSGTYRVVVSNNVSEISSNFASVIVNTTTLPVTINQQPQNLVVVEGDIAHFQINASGGGFISYQWRKNNINIENAYTNRLEISQTDVVDSGDYDVIVTNSRGSITSDVATLSVLSAEVPVAITLQPTSRTVFLAESINLRTAANGDGALNYQWFFNGELIIGANQAEYSINNAEQEHEGSYSVVVNNSNSEEESLAAYISVVSRPSVQLSWDTPSFREDGSSLNMSEISAYVIEYGDSPSATTELIRVSDATTTDYTLPNLNFGILYARIATVDSAGIQGTFSGWTSISVD